MNELRQLVKRAAEQRLRLTSKIANVFEPKSLLETAHVCVKNCENMTDSELLSYLKNNRSEVFKMATSAWRQLIIIHLKKVEAEQKTIYTKKATVCRTK